MELTELIYNYHQKKDLKAYSEEYAQVYPDGSKNMLIIESAEKETRLYDPDEREWYQATVLTKQFVVVMCQSPDYKLDWFDGKRFNTVKAAKNAIDKEAKCQIM